uniref:Major facilitator superfamily (MFS) profile domain-containing protein n=1 Tax=Parascaris univalens TaxID=6257 RepID=A0A914ZPW5_PARUN
MPNEDDNGEENKGNSKGRIDELITFNRYVLFLCFTYELVIIAQVGNLASMIFICASPDIIGCGETIFPNNISRQEACKLYESVLLPANNDSCKAMTNYQFRSVNVEWALFCDKEHGVKNTISYQMLGVMIGALIFGQLSDLFGRKTVGLCCIVGTIVTGSMSALAHNLFSFTLLRFTVGIFVGGNSTVMYVYVIENVPTNARFAVKTLVTWSPNFIILSLIAYLSGEWRTLLLAMNLLASPSLICFLFLYESPYWLLDKGRTNEAQNVLKKTSIWGITTKRYENSEELLEACIQQEQQRRNAKSKRYYFYHLFSSWKLFQYNLIISFSCFSVGAISYGLMFNLEKISGSLYINAAILGLFRYALNMLIAVADHFFKCIGRKVIHTFALLGIIISITFILFVNYFDIVFEYKLEVRAFTLLAVGMTATVFLVNGITNAELFPTAIRNIASAHALTWGRIGGIVAPQIFYLSTFHSSMPYAIIISMALLDVLLFDAFLPETKHGALSSETPGGGIPSSCCSLSRKCIANDENPAVNNL